MPRDENILSKVQNYRKIVLIYESLNKRIHQLLAENGGVTEHMSAEDIEQYRELAQKRDEMQNEMRWLEQELLDEDDMNQ